MAKRAGVSSATASFVLNNRQRKDGSIGEEARERVMEAAAQLDYRPNELARAMISGKSRVLGFVTSMPGLDVEFKARIFAGAVEEAGARGYLIKSLHTPSSYDVKNALEASLRWRLSGILTLALSSDAQSELATTMGEHGVPIAMLEDAFGAQEIVPDISVISDDRHGIALALKHLFELGHRKIAYLSAASDEMMGNYRVTLFRQEMSALGLEPNAIVYGAWWEIEANRRAALELLGKNPRPTAILCVGDPAATVVLNVAQTQGLQVPRDLSVVGFANYSLALYSNPPLTTIAQPFEQVGAAAARQLIEHIEGAHQRGKRQRGAATSERITRCETLPTSLVVRGSTARAPKELDQKSLNSHLDQPTNFMFALANTGQ